MCRKRLSGLAVAWRVSAVLGVAILFTSLLSSAGAAEQESRRVPLIYCSDLFHPPVDPDDWFDLATAFSIDEFDIRGIVLDQGEKQMQRTGRIPIE
ncbi:hypothetical protein HQ563_05320, partial [bacterium]|nr:hypothetical protein [bacterium]